VEPIRNDLKEKDAVSEIV